MDICNTARQGEDFKRQQEQEMRKAVQELAEKRRQSESSSGGNQTPCEFIAPNRKRN